MTRKTALKAIIGVSVGLFLATSTVAFGHNMGYRGNHHGPGMKGQTCPWNTTAQGTYGPMHGMMHNQAVNQKMPGQMRGPITQQGTPCGMNPQCPAAQAATNNATP